jgi:glycosyltransferase involved in cell wall biosynthesis
MKIGIDASRLRVGMSGIGRYIYNILAPLDIELPEARFVLYTRSNFTLDLPSDRWVCKQDTSAAFSRLPTMLWTRFRVGKLTQVDDLDVFWAANTLLPGNIGHVPCVTTIYDLNHLLAPATMPLLTRLAYRAWFSSAVLDSNCRVAISQGTSFRLESTFGRHADIVAKPAVPITSTMPSVDEAEEIIEKLGVRRPYVLTVGTLEPRKNLSAAIRAVEIQKSNGQLAAYQLAMVGARGWGGKTKGITESFEWLIKLGYVDDRMLASLYLLADVFVFPSIYEGYGIPVSEALAFGCRVVATDIPELREAGSDDVMYVDPTAQALATGIRAVLSQPAPSPKFPDHDWTDAARAMAKAFRHAVNLT